jgi:hypothetical protein
LVLVKQIRPPPVAFTEMELVPCPLIMVMVEGNDQLNVAPGMASTVKVNGPAFGQTSGPLITLGVVAVLTVMVIGMQVVVPQVPDART